MKGTVFWSSPKRKRYAAELEDGGWVWFEVTAGLPPSIGNEISGDLKSAGSQEIYLKPGGPPTYVHIAGTGSREEAHRYVAGET